MNEPIPRIRVYSSGRERLLRREVIRLVLYLPLDHHDLSAPVRRALDQYLHSFQPGPETLSEWYDFETEPFPLDDDNWDIIRAVMAPPQGSRFLDDLEDPQEVHRYLKSQFERAVELSGGAHGCSGYSFLYQARLPWRDPRETVSVVNFSWPTEHMETLGFRKMREFILGLATHLPFSSGHAGLAISSTKSSSADFADIRAAAFRHPGIDVTHGSTLLGRRVDGVHWMNFLGPPVLDVLGGLGGLRERLRSPGIDIQGLEGGRAVVTLGPSPRAGDLSRGDVLADHRELARALEPWLSTYPEGHAFAGASPAETQSWWRRFLDT